MAEPGATDWAGAGEAVSSGFEIERRWVVRVRPGLEEELGEGWRLRQGYVRGGDPAVRIRSGEPRGPVLACKAGKGVKRREAEVVVPDEVAALLFEAAGDRILEKVRYRTGGWELDWFQGDLEGLVLLERELEREDEPLPDPPRGVHKMLEVTDDKRFVSSKLAEMNGTERRALVERVHRELER